jgi:monoterpene epsilon-lactone hydrolase
MKNRFKNKLVKFFFRVSKPVVYRHNLKAEYYRKGMNFLTSFLGYPKSKATFEPFSLGGMAAEWVTPKENNNDKVFLYLHGGGYGMGSIKSHRSLATRIAIQSGCKMLLIDYRMAPENKFPCAVEDAVKAYNFLRLSGYTANQIIIGGDSAGGGLTVATLVRLRDFGLEMPLAGVCMSPWMDLNGTDPRMEGKQKEDPFIDIKSIQIWGQNYAGHDLCNPLASPKYADLTGLCPLLIQVGTSESLYYDSVALRDHCKRDGVEYIYEEYPDMIHVFQTFGGFLEEADTAIFRVAEFINRKTSTPSTISV